MISWLLTRSPKPWLPRRALARATMLVRWMRSLAPPAPALAVLACAHSLAPRLLAHARLRWKRSTCAAVLVLACRALCSLVGAVAARPTLAFAVCTVVLVCWPRSCALTRQRRSCSPSLTHRRHSCSPALVCAGRLARAPLCWFAGHVRVRSRLTHARGPPWR